MHVNSDDSYEQLVGDLVKPIIDSLIFEDYFSFKRGNSKNIPKINSLKKVG